MHAFNFSSGDSIEIQVGNNNLITDQHSFSQIKSGSVVQVRKKDISRKHVRSGWTGHHQSFRMNSSNGVHPEASRLRIKTERDYATMSATNEAALALAALSGDSEPHKFWALSEPSTSGVV